MIATEYAEDMRGTCDICLTSDCGPSGVRVIGTPVAVGRRCAERLAAALPVAAEASDEPRPRRVRRLAAA